MVDEPPRKYLLLPTVEDRLDMAMVAIGTMREYLPDWRIVVVAQEYSAASADRMESAVEGVGDLLLLPNRIGCSSARLSGLDYVAELEAGRGFIACSADDDMEFGPLTNLETAVRKAMEPGVGMVSCGWVPHPNRIRPNLVVDTFVKQPVVYTGGGLVFSSITAKTLLKIPRETRFFSENCEWSLATYTAGLTNWRYRGSLSVHRVCRNGGRKAYLAQVKSKIFPDPKLMTTRPTKDGKGFSIGLPSDLTPLAHAMHKAAAAARGF